MKTKQLLIALFLILSNIVVAQTLKSGQKVGKDTLNYLIGTGTLDKTINPLDANQKWRCVDQIFNFEIVDDNNKNRLPILNGFISDKKNRFFYINRNYLPESDKKSGDMFNIVIPGYLQDNIADHNTILPYYNGKGNTAAFFQNPNDKTGLQEISIIVVVGGAVMHYGVGGWKWGAGDLPGWLNDNSMTFTNDKGQRLFPYSAQSYKPCKNVKEFQNCFVNKAKEISKDLAAKKGFTGKGGCIVMGFITQECITYYTIQN